MTCIIRNVCHLFKQIFTTSKKVSGLTDAIIFLCYEIFSNIVPILLDAFCCLGSHTMTNALCVGINILTMAILKTGTFYIIAVQLVDSYLCLSAGGTASRYLRVVIIGLGGKRDFILSILRL